MELELTLEKCFGITPPQKEKLEEIAEVHNKEACKNAQTLLELVYHLSFPEVIEFPMENRTAMNDNFILPNQTVTSKIKIYPNPTNSDVYIEFNKEIFEESKITIRLTDIGGKELIIYNVNHQWESIDLSNIASGIYLILIETEGVVIEKQKLIKE